MFVDLNQNAGSYTQGRIAGDLASLVFNSSLAEKQPGREFFVRQSDIIAQERGFYSFLSLSSIIFKSNPHKFPS